MDCSGIQRIGQAFRRQRTEYEAHLKGELPAKLAERKHSLSWPVNLVPDAAASIWHYHDQNVALGAIVLHRGIDIKCDLGTKVIAPGGYSGRYVKSTCGLSNVALYAPAEKLLFSYAHLAVQSLPLALKSGLDQLGVCGGDLIGKVGKFVDGENNHVHFQIDLLTDSLPNLLGRFGSLYDLLESPEATPVNPLLLLEKLY